MTAGTPSLIGPLLAFGAVVALIPLALWLLKRTPLGGAAAGGGTLRVVAALPLAPNQRVVTVEVGAGEDRRWLVLGVTPNGIQTLHTMPPQDATTIGTPASDARAAAASSDGVARGGAFAKLLSKHRREQGAPGAS